MKPLDDVLIYEHTEYPLWVFVPSVLAPLLFMLGALPWWLILLSLPGCWLLCRRSPEER